MTQSDTVHAEPHTALATLEEISIVAEVPTVGLRASHDMAEHFEQSARQIEAVADEAVDRAMALKVTAYEFANNLRSAGTSLQERIELESAKALQIAQMMEDGRNTLAAQGVKQR